MVEVVDAVDRFQVIENKVMWPLVEVTTVEEISNAGHYPS